MTTQSPAQQWIDSLEIAEPCPADWNEMNGDDRARHCRLCNLNVYNVEAMKADEARALIESREGRTCVRLLRRPDGSVITGDCSAARRRIARMRWAVASGVGLILLVATQGWAAIREQRSQWVGDAEIEMLRNSRLHEAPGMSAMVDWIEYEYLHNYSMFIAGGI